MLQRWETDICMMWGADLYASCGASEHKLFSKILKNCRHIIYLYCEPMCMANWTLHWA